MATVYLAEDLKHHRKVAIKVLRPELAAVIGAERFLKEITTTANLQHPHILGLIDSGETDGQLWYVMPFVDGESLRDRLTREKQLPVADALRLASQVAGALDYAHRHGVIHRDIKPENILLHDGSALVADFGIALAASTAGSRMTETGMSLGSPQYMSPEQAMGEREITARSDVYALGCITYEMLAGEPPFNGPTAQAIIARVMTDDPRSLTGQRKTIPTHVEAAIFTALQKLPADRFGTAAEFASALSNASVTTQWSNAATRTRARPPYVAWGVAAAAIAIGAWGWLQRAPAPEVRWTPINLADTLGINPAGLALAVSPDGKLLVFRAFGANGLLWIKRPGALNPVAIPGTEGSNSPTFSPDGEWLAFIADRQLKKIRLDGSATTTLADSVGEEHYGIVWLDDNTLIYTPASGDEFRRVNASGGEHRTVLSDSTYRGYGFMNPTPLPKARGVLFLYCTSGCATTAVRVLDLATGKHKPLLSDAIQAWYLPTGDLMYVRNDGAVMVAPFDLDALEMRGPATIVLDNIAIVNVGNSLPMLAWSPAGTLLYFKGEGAGAAEMVRVNRAGAATPIDTSWYGGFNSLALSPDGKRLAVGAGQTTGGLNVWLKQLDRGPFSRFTFGGQDRRPAWSPDGLTIAFIRDSIDGGNVYTRLANSSGNDRHVAGFDRAIQEVTWSADGEWLVVRTDDAVAGLGDLLGIRLSGDTTPVKLVATQFTEMHPAVSPDNKWLAYISNESGTNEVYVRPFPETSAGRWQVSNAGGLSPVWSPTANELFFLTPGGELSAATFRSTPTFAVLTTQSLFSARTLVQNPFHQSFVVSPDGQSFIFPRNRATTANVGAPRAVLVENWFEYLRIRSKQ